MFQRNLHKRYRCFKRKKDTSLKDRSLSHSFSINFTDFFLRICTNASDTYVIGADRKNSMGRFLLAACFRANITRANSSTNSNEGQDYLAGK